MKTLVTAVSTEAGCLQSCCAVVVLSTVPVCAERYTEHCKKENPHSVSVVFITFAAVVCTPIGALPTECVLFLVTYHLFVRDYSE